MDEQKPAPGIWDRIANNVAEAMQPQPPVVITPEMRHQMHNSVQDTFAPQKK